MKRLILIPIVVIVYMVTEITDIQWDWVQYIPTTVWVASALFLLGLLVYLLVMLYKQRKNHEIITRYSNRLELENIRLEESLIEGNQNLQEKMYNLETDYDKQMRINENNEKMWARSNLYQLTETVKVKQSGKVGEIKDIVIRYKVKGCGNKLHTSEEIEKVVK